MSSTTGTDALLLATKRAQRPFWLLSRSQAGASSAGSLLVRIRRQDLSCRLSRAVPEAAVRRSRLDHRFDQLETDVFAPIAAFKAIFVPVVALALLIAALLSVTQVRRTLGPLEKLIEGTRRAGEQDFSTRVAVSSDDEFGELATVFNSMASRLGGQFKALLTLADIDHAILSRLDLDRVIETVVMRMRDIVPADYVSIAIVDRNAPAMVRIYTRDQRNDGRLDLERCVCPRCRHRRVPRASRRRVARRAQAPFAVSGAGREARGGIAAGLADHMA